MAFSYFWLVLLIDLLIGLGGLFASVLFTLKFDLVVVFIFRRWRAIAQVITVYRMQYIL